MAIIWKGLLSPDYLDGRFFSVTLVTDQRFENVALLFGGLTSQQLQESRNYLAPLPEGAELAEAPSFVEPRAFRFLIVASTWGLLAIEALIAFACLWPLGGRARYVPHLLVLLFCGVTYAFAPVAGFGWLLLTMGIAFCNPDQKWLRGAYLTAWCLVLLYDEIPWSGLLVEKLGRG